MCLLPDLLSLAPEKKKKDEVILKRINSKIIVLLRHKQRKCLELGPNGMPEDVEWRYRRTAPGVVQFAFLF